MAEPLTPFNGATLGMMTGFWLFLMVAVCVAMFSFLSGMSNWRAGWCVGPRYIVTVAPFLLVAVAYVWRRAPARPLLATLTAGLLIP